MKPEQIVETAQRARKFLEKLEEAGEEEGKINKLEKKAIILIKQTHIFPPIWISGDDISITVDRNKVIIWTKFLGNIEIYEGMITLKNLSDLARVKDKVIPILEKELSKLDNELEKMINELKKAIEIIKQVEPELS